MDIVSGEPLFQELEIGYGISGKIEWKLSLAVASWRRKGNGRGRGQSEVRGSHQEAPRQQGPLNPRLPLIPYLFVSTLLLQP